MTIYISINKYCVCPKCICSKKLKLNSTIFIYIYENKKTMMKNCNNIIMNVVKERKNNDEDEMKSIVKYMLKLVCT